MLLFSGEAALSLTVVCSDADYITSMYNNKWRRLGEGGLQSSLQGSSSSMQGDAVR